MAKNSLLKFLKLKSFSMQTRVIKFRAFDKFNDVYYHSDKWGTLSNFFEGVDRAVQGGNEVVLEQFIGLIDKQGVEIYEGDITESYTKAKRKVLRRIEFRNGAYYVVLSSKNKRVNEKIFSEMIFMSDLKVVGNIHENPELLNQK
jgi:uncharacterized phage protein (TIGR01671 family)